MSICQQLVRTYRVELIGVATVSPRQRLMGINCHQLIAEVANAVLYGYWIAVDVEIALDEDRFVKTAE